MYNEIKQLEIVQGNEFRVNISEKITERDYYYHAHKKASEVLYEIIKASELSKNSKLSSNADYLNNIIAFCGERGAGKTSTMLSFSEQLRYNKEMNIFDKLKDTNFLILDLIDPTRLENKDSIIKVVISKFFSLFNYYLKNSINSPDDYKIMKMYELFNSVYKNTENLSINKEDAKLFDGNIETLSQMADSENLRKSIQVLVDNLLNIISSKKLFIIIQIDDTDLNTSKAYEIVEDLRKYFIIPNVAILMGVHVLKLSQAIEQQFRKDYSIMLEYGRINSYELQQMCARYIEKLIPDGRKIYLPELKTSKQVKIVYKNDKGDILNESNGLESLLKLIYDKTNIVFMKDNNRNHFILPTTMRELVVFLSVIGRLKDITKDNSLSNLSVFEEYFINSWVRQNLDDGYIVYLEDIYAKSGNDMHLCTLNSILNIMENTSIYSLFVKKERKDDKEINDLKDYFRRALVRIKNKTMIKMDITLGLIQKGLNLLEELFPIESVRKFVFSIRTVYSIKLHKIYWEEEINPNNKENEEKVYYPHRLCEFTGGDIFDDLGNAFIRNERFSFTFRTDKYLQLLQKSEIEYSELMYIIPFLDYNFPQADYPAYNTYSSVFKSNNNTKAESITFNIGWMFINILQPLYLLDRLYNNSNDDFENEYNKNEKESHDKYSWYKNTYFNDNMKKISILLVCNTELVAHLVTNFNIARGIRATKKTINDEGNYYKDFFKRLYKFINTDLNYLGIELQENVFNDEIYKYIEYAKSSIDIDEKKKLDELKNKNNIIGKINTLNKKGSFLTEVSRHRTYENRMNELGTIFELAKGSEEELLISINENSGIYDDLKNSITTQNYKEYRFKINDLIKRLKDLSESKTEKTNG